MQHISPYTGNVSFNPTVEDIISRIPEHVKFQYELNLILTEGARSIRDCYTRLAENFDSISEHLSDTLLSSSEIDELKKGCVLLKEHIESNRVNLSEQEVLTNAINLPNSDLAVDLSKDADLKNLNPEEEVGFLGLLDKIADSLTEGKSPIGFLHLALDIISIIGDIPAIGPVGLIADIVNGLVYMFRGKYLLALLSFVGAAIPFAGPVIKRALSFSKVGKEVGEFTSKYFSKASVGSTKISDDAVELAAAASPESIKALEDIVEHTPKALDVVKNAIDTFFSGFLAKIASIIPFIGKPLSNMFKKIGSEFATFSRKASKLADDMPKILKEADLKNLDNFFKESVDLTGKKIIKKGDDLVIINNSGVVKARVPAKVLKGGDMLKKKYGGSIMKHIDPADLEKATIKFYDSLQSMLASSRKYQAMTIAGKKFILKRKIPILIGKSIYKLVHDFAPDTFNPELATDTDFEAVGIAHITRTLQQKMKDDLKKNPDAVYSVPIVDALDGESSYHTLNGYLESNAKMMNLPGGFPRHLDSYLVKRYKDEEDMIEYLNTVGTSRPIKEMKHIKRYE